MFGSDLQVRRDSPFTDAQLDEAWLANAIFDAHRDDPEFGYRYLVDEAREAGQDMSERTAWRLCSQHGWWSAFGKKRGKNGKKPGPPVHDDRCAITDEKGRTRHAFTAEAPHAVVPARGPCIKCSLPNVVLAMQQRRTATRVAVPLEDVVPGDLQRALQGPQKDLVVFDDDRPVQAREELLGRLVEVLLPRRFRDNHPAQRDAAAIRTIVPPAKRPGRMSGSVIRRNVRHVSAPRSLEASR